MEIYHLKNNSLNTFMEMRYELKLLVKEVKPDLIKVETVEKLDKTMLKKNGRVEDGKFYLGDTIIPSITVQTQEDKFEIK